VRYLNHLIGIKRDTVEPKSDVRKCTELSEKMMTFPEWKQLMQSEDGEFYRFSDLKKMNMYRAYLSRMAEMKLRGEL
jgi:hypothetical protein